MALIFLIYFLCTVDKSILEGNLWGVSTYYWIIAALMSPIMHQFYVLICWRLELYYNKISELIGAKGFKLYKVGFAILILFRPLTITLLAISNTNTFEINTTLSYILSIVLFIPAAYLFYSVKTYFGIDRAFGIDHFYSEKYKNASMVKKGIFKYTSNGMYIYGFLILWIPGILFKSKAALLLALFNHIYIWVHYYLTEKPDMREIYRENY